MNSKKIKTQLNTTKINKREFGSNRVVFYSKEDLGIGVHLTRAEIILKGKIKTKYTDINDILELYNIKKFIDHSLHLVKWTQYDVDSFRSKVSEYGRIIGKFISNIDDNNFIIYHKRVLYDYIKSFWELVNNQNSFNHISKNKFANVLEKYPDEITQILTFKKLVKYYNEVIRDFLLSYQLSAEILLTIYEVKDIFNTKGKMYLPHALTVQDKEFIISQYIDYNDANINYLRLIPNSKKRKVISFLYLIKPD